MLDLLQDTTTWLIFSFGIFAVICWKLGAGAITGMLDDRIRAIRTEIRNAEDLRVEAQELLAQYERRHRGAMQEAQSIVTNAQDQAKALLESTKQTLGENLRRREKQLADRIALGDLSAELAARAYAAKLTVEATAAIIAQRMDTEASHRLVDEAIHNLPEIQKIRA